MRITKQDINELDLKSINSMTDTELEEFCTMADDDGCTAPRVHEPVG